MKPITNISLLVLLVLTVFASSCASTKAGKGKNCGCPGKNIVGF